MDLCDRCLGRILSGAQGVDAQREAARERRALTGADEVAEADCRVCEGAFEEADAWLAAALEAVGGYEFSTFQVGTVFPSACEALEKDLRSQEGSEITDSLRTEANRWLGPRIAEATGAVWQTDGRPDLVLQVDTRFWTATVTANSLFLAGRYTKHRRDVPQTRWPCKRCQGRGCWECDGEGLLYGDSVEQTVGDPALMAFEAAGHSFHGAGREDIDALMLGTGRPFVLELHSPHKRTIDLAALEAAINATTAQRGTGVSGLRASDKEEVVRIKGADYQKEYLAHCLTGAPVTADAVEAAAQAMSGVTLDQRTPQRVAHRRADLVRNRTVEKVTVETPVDASGTRFSLRVLAESGTYIKEMISSDEGRTTPSFAATLGVECKVEFLDVVGILDEA